MSDINSLENLLITSSAVTTPSDSFKVLCFDVDGKFKPVTVANLMQAFRDSIQIGGRNLLKATEEYKVTTDGAKWLNSKCVLTIEELIECNSLTFSCKYKKTGNPTSGNIGVGAIRTDSWWDSKLINVSEIGDTGVIVKTFAKTTTSTKFSLYAQGVAGVELYDFKLERGNMATDWSPAPEDLLSQSGGGKMLHFIYLRSLAERRVA